MIDIKEFKERSTMHIHWESEDVEELLEELASTRAQLEHLRSYNGSIVLAYQAGDFEKVNKLIGVYK